VSQCGVHLKSFEGCPDIGMVVADKLAETVVPTFAVIVGTDGRLGEGRLADWK